MAEQGELNNDGSEIKNQGQVDGAASLASNKETLNGKGGGKKDPANATDADLDFILDVPLDITVELGRTKMIISDLLKLGQGSVIELNKPAGDTLEILANNRLIAKGDVVVVNDKYGIRLTEVITPMERVEKLG